MKVIIHNARQAYMTYFDAKSIKGSKPSYSGTYIIDKDTTVTIPDMEVKRGDPGKLLKAVEKVIKDKFGKTSAKDKNWAVNKADGTTTRDEYVNDSGDYHDGFTEKTWYVSGKKYEDQVNGDLYVVDQNKNPITPQSGVLFPGCRVNVVLDFYAFDADGTKGCTASLEGVQLKASGEPLKLGGGSTNAADDFDEEEVPEDDASELM